MDEPGFVDIFKVNTSYSATLYLTKKYDEAFESFTTLVDASINNSSYNELKLWQWASITNSNKQKRINIESPVRIDFVASYDKFMQQYPESIKFKLSLLYVKDLFNSSNLEDAKNTLDIITYGDVPKEFENDVNLLEAKIALRNGDEEKALATLKLLSENVEDRKNRAAALFELTKYNLVNGIYETEEAIEKFLLSSTIWRDDFFEMDVYETVGSLYISNEDYVNALLYWDTLVKNFPQTTESIFVLGKMKDLFIELFDSGIAYGMEPLQALRIYFKYNNLMPSGEVGDRITRKMGQFFIQADMIEDAIDIILHQIKYRSAGEEFYIKRRN